MHGYDVLVLPLFNRKNNSMGRGFKALIHYACLAQKLVIGEEELDSDMPSKLYNIE